MKKVICALLSLVLLLGCAAYGEAADLLGTWYAELSGIAIELTVREDGTYTAFALDRVMAEGKWECADHIITLFGYLGYDAGFTVGENELTGFGEVTNGLVFTREQSAAYKPAPFKADAALEDFSGVWASKYEKTRDGWYVDPEIGHMGMYIQIDGTRLQMIGTMGWLAPHELFPDRSPGPYDLEFAHGALHLERSQDGTLQFSVTLTMMVDGGMRMDIFNINPFGTEYEEELYFYPYEADQ